MIEDSRNVPRDLVARLERSEMAAEGDFFRSAPPESIVACGAGVQRFDGALALQASRVDVLAFNRLIGIGLDEPVSGRTISTVLNRFERRGVARFFVQVSPAADQPETVAALLQERRFEHYNNWLRLYRAIAGDVNPPSLPPGLSIELLKPERGRLFGEMLAASFDWPASVTPWLAATIGRPGWRHYLAFVGDMAAGTAAMHVEDRLGWMDFASTMPAFRGRGVQSALIARRIADAAALGCTGVHMETAEPRPDHPAPAYDNAREAGFEMLYRRPNYLYRRGVAIRPPAPES